MITATTRWRTAVRFVDRHRRLAAALCAAIAVGAGLSVIAPAPARTTAVVAAARELPAGHVISAGDLHTVALPAGSEPEGVVSAGTALIGRSVALPVRRGEVLTDVRLHGTELRRQLAAGGLLIAPVRIADPAAVALLAAGDRIDILGAVEGQPQAVVVAADVLVVDVPKQTDSPGFEGVDGGALVVVATTAQTSRRLAQAAVGSRLSVVLRA